MAYVGKLSADKKSVTFTVALNPDPQPSSSGKNLIVATDVIEVQGIPSAKGQQCGGRITLWHAPR